MPTQHQIKKEKQLIERCEKSLTLKKLKQRRADTRRKIEFGGLVIKAGMDGYDKAIIMGALNYASELLKEDEYRNLFQLRGQYLFLK